MNNYRDIIANAIKTGKDFLVDSSSKIAEAVRTKNKKKAEQYNNLEQNIKKYLYPGITTGQVKQIRLGLKSGIDVSVYAKQCFSYLQMEQIRLGLKFGIDVLVYAKPEFNHRQMEEIREGLISGLDVSTYAKPNINWLQMFMIRNKLGLGQEISSLTKSKSSDNRTEDTCMNHEPCSNTPYSVGLESNLEQKEEISLDLESKNNSTPRKMVF